MHCQPASSTVVTQLANSFQWRLSCAIVFYAAFPLTCVGLAHCLSKCIVQLLFSEVNINYVFLYLAGLLIAIAIGVLIGVLCGFVFLMLAFVCRRRYRAKFLTLSMIIIP